MKTAFHTHALAAASTLAFALPATRAQNVPPAPPKPPVHAIAAGAPAADQRFDLELASPTPAQDVIELISEKLGHPVNVVWSGDSTSALLPALRLHQVTLREFLGAVTAVGRTEMRLGRAGFEFSEIPEAANVYTFSVIPPAPTPSSFTRGPEEGGAVARINGGVQLTAPSTPPAPAKISQFFDLSVLLNDELKIDDITTAIRTAWTAAADGAEPPTEALRYHQETQLLIATDSPERLKIVENIVDLLRSRNEPSKEEKDQAIARLKRELEEINKDRDIGTMRLRDAEKKYEAEVSNLRERIAELEIELAKQRKAL